MKKSRLKAKPEHKCEWNKKLHNYGTGCWWLKDPEWLWLCPNCTHKYWDKQFARIMKNKRLAGQGTGK
jgi:hypothetical protein